MKQKCWTVLWNFLIHFLCITSKVGSAKAGPLLLYSTDADIRILNATTPANQSDQNPPKIKPHILVKNVSECAAIDFHYADKKLFWTDQSTGSIQTVPYTISESGTIEIHNEIRNISRDLSSPDGLACDWFSNNIYWTDSETKRIEVASIAAGHRKVLFWTELDQPRAIAVLPMKGIMFWTDWGDSPKIERAGMNGDPATRQVIVSTHIVWPNGLTIDYAHDRIYWIDGKLQLFEVMDYNGGGRKVVVDHMAYPFALTQYADRFYWTDWQTGSIHYYDQTMPNRSAQELLHSDRMPMDIHVWDAHRQPAHAHPCAARTNGGCSHLCLLAPPHSAMSLLANTRSHTNAASKPVLSDGSSLAVLDLGYTCACPIGTKLVDNMTCADGPQEILLVARKSDIAVVYLDSPDFTDRELKLTNIKYSIGVDYDPVHQHVYWTDDEVRRIQRARLDGTDQRDILSTDIQHPDGVAVDAVAGNVYWADTGTDRIEVARLDGRYRRVVIGDDLYEPRAVVVAPELGYLFWSDWYERRPKIERANLDGSERTVLVQKDLIWPNGVAVDTATSRIYWCDAKTDKIEYANLDGTDRRSLVEANMPHCFGLSLIGEYVYWTDWQRRTINRVHKESGDERQVIVEQIENLMGLKAIRLEATVGTNACSNNNGDCEQICLYRHNKTYTCACQIGFELRKDKRTCVKPDAFLLYTRNNSLGRLSIENGDNDVSLFIPGVKYPSSIDFDVTDLRLYWSDARLHTISRAYINGSDVQRVVEVGLVAPEGVAIDWVTLNLYWADPVARRIEVARLDGSSRRALLWRDVNQPRTIALDPQRGYMYWSEWGDNPGIKRAAMDGSGPRPFLEETGRATGLTLDHDQRRLYWASAKAPLYQHATIYSSDLDGNNRVAVVANGLGRPVGLTVFSSYLYWSDEETGNIWQANKTNGQNRSLIQTFEDPATDLLVFSTSKQNGSFNQCAVGNGGCSHLCLALPQPNSTTYTCACPTHYVLQNNTCIPPANFMIYSQKNLAVRLLQDTTDCLDAVLPIQGLKGVKAIDFDPGLQFLYWIEGKTHAIKRAKAIGLHISIVLASSQENHPFDLALDAIGRLLFWSCSLKNVINVTRLDNGSTVGVIVSGEKPRLIAIHPTKRLIFYTDIGTGELIRTRMDGTQRLVITKASAIEAIAVDTDSGLIFWSRGQSIYMCNIDGDNVYVVLNETNSNISQLTVHAGWLYWIDRNLGELQRFELKSGKSRTPVLSQIGNVVDLISVRQPDRNHQCYVAPGTSASAGRRCSHFCLVTEDGGKSKSALCACPHDQSLQEDARSCVVLPDCGPEHFSCVQYAMGQKECIPITWRCDGQNDCNDNSDEQSCPTCRPDQYRCQNSQCIEQAQYCDGADNCADRSDELKCCKLPAEFRCPMTDVCIATSLLCDGMEHCADGADERPEVCANSSPHIKRDYHSNYILNTFIILFAAMCTFLLGLFVCYYLRRKYSAVVDGEVHDQSHMPLNPLRPCGVHKGHNKMPKGIPDLVHMSMLNGTTSGTQQQQPPPTDPAGHSTSSYDRNHITGASSSTNDSSSLLSPSNGGVVVMGGLGGLGGPGYPPEPLNPPPSPATTAPSSCMSSHNSRHHHYHYYGGGGGGGSGRERERDRDHHHRPYRYYRAINQPPPPTPCSTDVCDDSEYNYPLVAPSSASVAMVGTSNGNTPANTGVPGMFPPPPTPRSQCHSESCPPSPSSRSSTYFSPLPPPPSPVPSTLPPHYDDL